MSGIIEAKTEKGLARYRPYPAYKDSGVEWLGEVPEGWASMPLKRRFDVRLGKMLQSEPKTSDDSLLPYIRAANINWDGVDVSDLKEMWFSPSDRYVYKLEKLDLLVSEGGDVGRSALWEGEIEDCYIQNAVNRVRSLGPDLTKYLYYWLYMLKNAKYIDELCNRATISHFTAEKVKELLILIPSLLEQKLVVRFIEQRTNQLGLLIAKQERLIELLQEKRVALITRAVTKGLDLDVPMKDSGVEWLGEIPEHWEVTKITWIYSFGSGTTPKTDGLDYYDGDIPWVTTSELRENVIGITEKHISQKALQDYSALKIYPAGSLLIAMYGATIGRMGILGLPATVNQACCVLYQAIDVNSIYAFYWLQSYRPILISWSSGGGQPNLSQDVIRTIRIPLPLLIEQNKIVAYIEKEIYKIDGLIDKARKSIKLLKEYRTALISAAVTGKIDVRGEVS